MTRSDQIAYEPLDLAVVETQWQGGMQHDRSPVATVLTEPATPDRLRPSPFDLPNDESDVEVPNTQDSSTARLVDEFFDDLGSL